MLCCTFLYCTISTLYLFDVALSSYCTIFVLYCFSCCTPFMYAIFMYLYISFCTFTRCNVFNLHSSPVALLAYCTFFPIAPCSCCMLHCFHRCNQDLHKHLWWRALQQQLTKPFLTEHLRWLLLIVAKISILDVCWGSGYASPVSMFHFFIVKLFSFCTFLILKIIENKQKKENATTKTLRLPHWTCFTFFLISCNTFLSLYRFQ